MKDTPFLIDVTSFKNSLESIDWDKPKLETIQQVIAKRAELETKVRDHLASILHNKDAVALVEDPTLIDDLGSRRGWSLERFLTALGEALSHGCIQITSMEDK